jgi:hypothetical protein
MSFKSEMMISEKAMNGMKEVAIEFAESCVRECARIYKFDGDEAVRQLGLRSPLLITKRTKEKRHVDKPRFTFPYSGGRNEDVCQGLILNGGLFTQCEMSKKTQLYCGKCSKQAEKNAHGSPNYGTIMDRNSVGIMEYIDPSGKSPVPYMKYINKKKWDLSEIQAEAKKYSININEIHFVEESSSKRRGRKPRVRSQVAYDTDDESSQDMFDTINDKEASEAEDVKPPPSSNDDDVDDISSQFERLEMKSDSVAVVETLVPEQAPSPAEDEVSKGNDLEEEEEVLNEETKSASQDAVSKKPVKKTDKSEKQKQKELEKQAKLDEKKAAAAAKEMEKKKKDEETAAAKKAAAAEKQNSKSSKSPVSKQGSNSSETAQKNAKPNVYCDKGKEPCIVEPAKAPQPAPKKSPAASVSVKPFTHNGVKYYKSADNILYDKSGNAQGKWEETTKTITPIIEDEEDAEEEDDESEAEDNSEEEEEEYEEEEEPQGSARYASKTSDILDEIEYYECLGSD